MDADRPSRLEWKLRAAAIPAALAIALAFHAWPLGHFFQRTWLSMMVHELGHAVTAWWTGFAALPGLWKTLIPETRGAIWIAVAALELGLVVYGWRRERMAIAAAGLALAVVQWFGTTLPVDTAQAWIAFGGDGMGMVLGSLLMIGFFVPRLAAGGLRWGVLVIGAAAYVDTFATWWTARHDPDIIPFGEIEGVGLSDPSKLSEVYNWSTSTIVHRFVTVGVTCGVVLAAVWAWQTWRARAASVH